jgi:hypothetical protein
MAFKELILNNFWLKGFSLVLATLIWFALSQSDLPTDPKPMNPFAARTKERDVPRAVAVLKGPAEQRVFRIDPAQVTVKVSGDPNMLDLLNPEDIHAYVNVGALRDPQGSIHVEVHVPARITVVAVSPAHVDVRPISTNP